MKSCDAEIWLKYPITVHCKVTNGTVTEASVTASLLCSSYTTYEWITGSLVVCTFLYNFLPTAHYSPICLLIKNTAKMSTGNLQSGDVILC
jgi:hypothetical protein